MAYADRDRTSENTVGIGVTAVLVALLSWALYTGLAAEGFRAIVKKVTAVDIKKDEPKKEEKPPPPPKKDAAPPPIVVPPPITNINTRPPPVETTTQAAPPPAPIDVPRPAPEVGPPPPPPPPPPPKGATSPAKPKGNPGSWVTNDDYPTRAMREERQGTTGFRLTIGPDGRATGCDITSSSGSPDLDSTACSLLMRRAKFSPALEDGQPVSGSYSGRFRWEIPSE